MDNDAGETTVQPARKGNKEVAGTAETVDQFRLAGLNCGQLTFMIRLSREQIGSQEGQGEIMMEERERGRMVGE